MESNQFAQSLPCLSSPMTDFLGKMLHFYSEKNEPNSLFKFSEFFKIRRKTWKIHHTKLMTSQYCNYHFNQHCSCQSIEIFLTLYWCEIRSQKTNKSYNTILKVVAQVTCFRPSRNFLMDMSQDILKSQFPLSQQMQFKLKRQLTLLKAQGNEIHFTFSSVIKLTLFLTPTSVNRFNMFSVSRPRQSELLQVIQFFLYQIQMPGFAQQG